MENNNLQTQIQDAIDHIDGWLAHELLFKIKKGEITSSEALNFVPQLQVLDFSRINDEELASVMKNHVLDFFRLQIPFGTSISARYTEQGGYQKNNQRVIMKNALLENQEKLGNLSVSEWVKKFDSAYDPEERTEQDILNFLINDNEARMLNNPQKNALKSILKAYIDLLESRIVDADDLVDAYRRLKEKGLSVERLQPRAPYASYREGYAAPAETLSKKLAQQREEGIITQRPATEKRPPTEEKEVQIIKIPFKVAAEKYPGVYKQRISASPITSSVSPTPMESTIQNWIRDFHGTMGTQKHSMMERSDYLYNQSSTQSLSEQQKQMLFEIIRSLEDNTPIDVDVNSEKIVFKQSTTPATPKPPMQPQTPPSAAPQEPSVQQQRTQYSPSPEITVPSMPPTRPFTPPKNNQREAAANRAGNGNMELKSEFHQNNISNVEFDSPHKLPNE